ncbi:sigma-54 interaction domain-containing protein [Fimbriiglobus ruber]|uniref:Response regulator of zinc sigma-54-dependent two-component system n=1 Tax=Fimbriiglobus ruber TaxID=1908690 RepID=A0A225E1B3_9BACT|nr:sigma 54-interacting transcriptional regulator [Fimbriiglobus ruber]OWK47510.1 Response regulator of zinc sigma-54-dependent two-component system [Fimbriiglobus ruber]
MTFARRILLVGTDHRFSQMVQTHLHKTFLLTAPVIRAEDIPGVVTRETDGVLLFLAADPQDADRIETTIRELRLQSTPAKLAVLESEDFATGRRLEHIVQHLDGRFLWPAQLRDLNSWARKAITPGVGFVDPSTESVSERLRRRLLAHTPSLAHMIDQLDIAASHDVTVLIEGETGTGKTHLARLIHECSARAPHRFLVLACGTLSGNLIASEFFGHVKGAFTGADSNKVGKFAAAGQGTILLDEIDTLGLEHQANLLRVIETGEYEPVGGNETQVCQARIIAATNWNLLEAVDRGTFRRDLYYRLHVITFHLPPLRARPQDVGPLVRGMIARYGTRFGKKIYAVHPDAMRALEEFAWPGNIRQLENVIQQSVLTCTGDSLTLSHLPPMIHTRADGRPVEAATGVPSSLAQNRETTERAVIIRALEKVGFSRTRAAQVLGVSRVTLYKKMKKYGLLSKPNGLAPGTLDYVANRLKD